MGKPAAVNLEFYETGVLKTGIVNSYTGELQPLLFTDGQVHYAEGAVEFEQDGIAKCQYGSDCWER